MRNSVEQWVVCDYDVIVMNLAKIFNFIQRKAIYCYQGHHVMANIEWQEKRFIDYIWIHIKFPNAVQIKAALAIL